MQHPPATLIPLPHHKSSHNPPIQIILVKRQQHPAIRSAATPKTLILRIRLQPDRLTHTQPAFFSSLLDLQHLPALYALDRQSFSLPPYFLTSPFKPTPPGSAPPSEPRALASSSLPATNPPKSLLPAQS